MAQTDSETLSLIEGLLKEQRTFPPTEEFRRSAIIQDDAVYRAAEEDFEGFWARLADEFIEWYRKPEKRLDRARVSYLFTVLTPCQAYLPRPSSKMRLIIWLNRMTRQLCRDAAFGNVLLSKRSSLCFLFAFATASIPVAGLDRNLAWQRKRQRSHSTP
jgi:hypothetical protein